MKSWSRMLHKMFDALAFANAGNLGALQNMLRQHGNPAKQGSVPSCAPAIKNANRAEVIELVRPHRRAG